MINDREYSGQPRGIDGDKLVPTRIQTLVDYWRCNI